MFFYAQVWACIHKTCTSNVLVWLQSRPRLLFRIGHCAIHCSLSRKYLSDSKEKISDSEFFLSGNTIKAYKRQNLKLSYWLSQTDGLWYPLASPLFCSAQLYYASSFQSSSSHYKLFPKFKRAFTDEVT